MKRLPLSLFSLLATAVLFAGGAPARAQEEPAAAAEAADAVPAIPDGYTQLAETPNPEYDLRLQVGGSQPATLAIALADAEHGYRLRLGAEAAVLERLDGGQAVELTRAARPYQGDGPHEVIVRRRAPALYVVVDGRIVLDVLDGTYGPGLAAVRNDEGVSVTVPEAGYQPTESIYFSDDFMRTEDQQQLGVWQHLSGKWRFYSVLETNAKADFKLSVNPFSLGLSNDGATAASVLAGYPFWCDYDAALSVRCRSGSWGGLIFSHRGEGDYYLLRADLREHPVAPRRIELVRVKGGQEKVLAGGTALLSAEQWYRLGVRLRGPRLQCLLDEGVIFDLVDPELTGGPIGAWAQGTGETLFDDVYVTSNYTWPFDREAVLAANGRSVRGEWALRPAGGPPIGNDPGPRQLVAAAPAPSLYTLGDPAAQDYRLDTQVAFDQPAKIGFVFGYVDSRNYHYAAWQTAEERLYLGQVIDGQVKPLGLVRDRLAPGQRHTVSLDLLTPGRVQVRRDGLLRMRATLDDVPAGSAGLLTDGAPARFSDLAVRQWVPVDTEVEVDNDSFADDPFMLHWASSLADWFPKGDPAQDPDKRQVYWHKGDFYRAYRLEIPANVGLSALLNATEESWRPPGDAGIGRGTLKIEKIDEQQDPGDGYALHLVKAGTPEARVHLYRQGVHVTDAPVPADLETLVVAHDGGVTWIEGADGSDLLVYHDHQPLDGPRVALRVADQNVLYNVKSSREGIIDEVFERAPAAWVQQGEWEITNRFSCTPTWSHMTALERGGLGALWHKAAFPGNVTIEYYAGMRMQSDYSMIYPRPGDFNVTFGARALDLASGISLLPGAWDPGWSGKWTRYVRGTETLAETDRPLVPRTREDSGQRYIAVPYISSGRDIHGAWYYVKSRMVGDRLEAYFDNEPILQTGAPATPGDRIAVWTQDNQVVVARVRITYEEKVIPPRLISADPVEVLPAVGPTLLLTTNEAPGVAFDFDDSTQGWAARDRFRGVRIEQAAADGRRFLQVTNQLPGDSLEAVMPLGNKEAGQPESLSLSHAAVLRFDYRIDPATKINAYLTLNGDRYTIPLTGSREDGVVQPVLVRPGDIVADGQWHTARLPLGAALRARFGKEPPALTDFRFGQLHEGYLLAGFGGNGRGASYAIDNFAIVPEVGGQAALTPVTTLLNPPLTAGEEPQPVSVKVVRAALDRQPDTLPTEPLADGALKTADKSGVYYLHAQAELEDGTRTAPVHLPLLVVAGEPPLKPAGDDAGWDGGPLTLAFGDSAPTDITFTVGEKALDWAQAVTVDPEQRHLVLDPSAAGLQLSDGQAVPMKVAATFANGARREIEIQRVYSRTVDERAPSRPVVEGAGVYYDFEHGQTQIEPYRSAGRYTVVRLIDDSPEPGGHAAQVANQRAGASMYVTVPLPKDGIDLGRHPLLMFDYRAEEPVRFDFSMGIGGDYYSLPVLDNSGSYPRIVPTVNGVRDGQWQRATVNLQQAVAAQPGFDRHMYALRWMYGADFGYSGAAPGASYALDNVRFARVANGAQGIKLSWSAYDAGGIAEWRVGWSEDAGAAPTETLAGDVTEQTFTVPGEGLRWFAIQARDQAGNWSGVTRVPLLLDTTAPAFGAPTPAPGALGDIFVRVPLANVEQAGIDPASLKLTVGKETASVRQGQVEYDATSNTLAWNWAWATKLFAGKVADGTELPIKLEGADLAGNAAAPASWAYKVSYEADKQPPLAPTVTVENQPVAVEDTFTTDLGAAGTLRGAYTSPRARFFDPERADHVLKVTTSGDGIAVVGGGIDLAKHPYLSFDYKVDKGVALHLLVWINGEVYSVALNGKSRQYKQIGQVDLAADNKWHTLVVNMLDLAKSGNAQPKAKEHKLTRVVINEYGSRGGQTYLLDNVTAFGPSPKEVKAKWVCYDATGIQGAATALVAKSLDAAPPEKLTADQRAATLTAAGAGIHLLQVRCRDGAGNWGGTARRVLVIQ